MSLRSLPIRGDYVEQQCVIDVRRKNELQRNAQKDKKSVRVILTIARILLIVGLVGGGLYLILNFISPTISTVNVNGVIKKDISWIIISSSFIIAPCLILSVCLNVLAKNIAGVDNTARIDESLVLFDDFLRYSFRIKNHSLPSERIVIQVKYNEITSITKNDKRKLLIFRGHIESRDFNDYKKGEVGNKDLIDIFLLYDYFNPSLIELITQVIPNNIIREE